ncbi:hypothetical protein [Streptomyces sp. NPDC089915]|uniref:hypothetical protein n=1 Tax=Streptomyces sp. NPDC089915 TaxID=3155186 RepID=UPI0034133B9F
MPGSTADELLASVHGLSPEDAQQIAEQIDECRGLLAAGTGMDTVQQHLKDQGVSVFRAVLITTRPLGNHPRRLQTARELVECSPAHTPDTALNRPRHPTAHNCAAPHRNPVQGAPTPGPAQPDAHLRVDWAES